jgi:IS4 transposase
VFFRVKSTGTYQYLQIAQSFRTEGKVRQRIIATLGRLDVLKQSGQLDSLLRSGLRLSERIAALDAHAAGAVKPVQIRRIGPDLVFGRLWEESGIASVLKELLSKRNFKFEVERAVYLTVLHCLFSPGSDRAADTWREDYRIPGVEGLELHHFYRAMAWLGEELEEASELEGVARTTKDRIEEQLFDHHRDLFSEVDLVFFDTTSLYFEGQGGQSLGQYGFSKDHRPDLRQMVVGLALDAQGWPICSLLWPGNTTDARALLPVVQRFQRRFRVKRVSVVADRGMISRELVEALESGAMGCQYILGVRLRSSSQVGDPLLRDASPWQELEPERQRASDPSPLKVKEVMVAGRRHVLCLNEEQRRKDAADREAIVASLREALQHGAGKRLIGNKGYRKYVKTPELRAFEVDEAKIKAEAAYDGLWALQTNMDLETELVARTYKQLWTVEDLFRTMKSALATRPIFHKRDETIRGHVFCSFLALRLRRELEQRLEKLGHPWEWAQVIRGLDQLSQVTLNYQGKKFLMRSELSGQAGLAIRATGVAMPPAMREAPADPA